MSNIVEFAFEDKQVRTLTDERDGSAWFVLKDVLSAMGSKTRPADAKTSIEEVFGGEVANDYPIIDSLGRTQTATIINEPAVTFLVSRSNTESGKKLNRWIHGEVIPSIRKTGSYSTPSKQHRAGSPAELLEGAEALARLLNLNGSSLVGATRRLVKQNCPYLLPMIPDYAIDAPVIAGGVATSSEPCYSLTELLKRNGITTSPANVNKMLMDVGLLEEKTRPSIKNGVKKFKCITQKGLAYGKNVVNENSPRETQPQWFESRFSHLLDLID